MGRDGAAARPPHPFPATARFERDRLIAVGGVAVADLVAGYGTPLYVIDHDEFVGRVRAYRAAFGPDVAVAYAAKALCVTGILQIVARQGLHLDVASGGELRTAERAAFPPDRILFHGNNKSTAELEHAARAGVGRVVADSFTELRRIEEVGERLVHVFDVLVRVTPGVEAHTHAFIRTGHEDSKFGFTLSTGLAGRALTQAAKLPHVRLRGVHCHIGSQILRTEPFQAGAEALCELVASVRDVHGVQLEEMNLGGGLGIAYGPGDAPPDLDVYADAVLGTVARCAERFRLGPLRLTVEPGRSLVGPAGVTLYEIGTVKPIPGGRTYVSVDGGMSDNLRPALYGARYTFALAGSGAPADQVTVTIVGKHCETGDVLGLDVRLPADLAEGDVLAMAATGAYGHAMASNYNRLARPAMVLVRDGEARLLVRRESLDDVVDRDVPLGD